MIGRMMALFFVLMVCLSLAFVYPRFVPADNLTEAAAMLGICGAIVDFFCILVLVFKKDSEEVDEEDEED